MKIALLFLGLIALVTCQTCDLDAPTETEWNVVYDGSNFDGSMTTFQYTISQIFDDNDSRCDSVCRGLSHWVLLFPVCGDCISSSPNAAGCGVDGQLTLNGEPINGVKWENGVDVNTETGPKTFVIAFPGFLSETDVVYTVKGANKCGHGTITGPNFNGDCDPETPECVVDSDCPNFDSIACTEETCVNSICVSNPSNSLCNDGFSCSENTCSPNNPEADNNGCVTVPRNSECDDNASCSSNTCAPGNPLADENGCIFEPINAECDDGFSCSVDTCEPKNPLSDPVSGCIKEYVHSDCADDFDCSIETCEPNNPAADFETGCVIVPRNSECDDGFSCSNDFCAPNDPSSDVNGCIFVPQNSECDDGFSCSADTCDPNNEDADIDGCVYDLIDIECDNGASCSIETCEPNNPEADGNGCISVPRDSECDGAACSLNTCSPNDPLADANGCVMEPRNSECNDGFSCSVDTCDPNNEDANDEGCVYELVNGSCGDGFSCSTDTCEPNNPDADLETGCVYELNNSVCDDELSCATGTCNPDDERKDENGCVFTPNDSCDDGIACTADTCDPTNPLANRNGCVFTPIDSNCDDGASCSDDTCSPDNENADSDGCVYEIYNNRCNDDIPCTEDFCIPGSELSDDNGCFNNPDTDYCDDGATCSDNSCDPDNILADPKGCVNTFFNDRCDKDIECSSEECKPSETDSADGCVSTIDNSVCEDDNVCTSGSCIIEEGGCVIENNTNLCDDASSCTFDDKCVDGECEGIAAIDFEITQDREPLPLGVFDNSNWSRWGVTVSVFGSSTLTVVDSATTSDTRFQFPSSLISRGGADEQGKILVVTGEATNRICFSFSSPKYVESTVLLSVSTLTTSVDFVCAGSGTTENVKAKCWGPGSAEKISNPCTDTTVSVCYNNLQDAAIAGIFMCDTPDPVLGSIGDYVWHDFNFDNVQNPIEVGIPRVDVVLKVFGEPIEETRTDSNGYYLFENLYEDTYTVEFFGPSGYRFSTPSVELFNGRVFHEGMIDDISLGEGETDLTIDAGLYVYGSIGDYIFLDNNRNGLQDETEGVPGVVMTLYKADQPLTPYASTQTNSIGFYSFENLPIFDTATTYTSWIVEITPPEKSIVTIKNAGNNVALDSDFDPVTLRSDVVVLSPSNKVINTVDGGIYFCCGSIGDFVWFDTNADGIQDINESGASGVSVVLFRDGTAYETSVTDENGFYLFTELPLSGTYKVFFKRPSGFVFTSSSFGNDDSLDSDADSSGNSHEFTLSPQNPEDLTIDAGLKEGCDTAEECGPNMCEQAFCVDNQCEYFDNSGCESPENPCMDVFCNPDTGDCSEIPTNDENRPCDDGNVCTSGDVCDNRGGCSGTPNNNLCDDGNLCTFGDECIEGECVGIENPCDVNIGDNVCVEFNCDSATGTCVPTILDDNVCDDGNECTTNDVCIGGECLGDAIDCSVTAQCVEGFCDNNGSCDTRNIPSNTSCDDGDECTTNDACEEGVCVGEPIVCEPISPCHQAQCIFGECENFVLENIGCDDGDDCTENDLCTLSGECLGSEKECNTQNPCALAECNNGDCTEIPNPDGICDDGDDCTTNICEDTECVAEEIECDDQNPCTDDFCENGVCTSVPNSESCDDNDACTSFDECTAGQCSGVPVDCDDGNECTTNTCDPISGQCVTTNNEDFCDDGNDCTLLDVCVEGECTGYNENTCDDLETNDNSCLSPYCMSETGECSTRIVEDNTPCDDGDSCTENDVCVSGNCEGTRITCNDDNICTDDFCLDGACVTVDNSDSCDDGDLCTERDFCVAGSCLGSPLNCDDENVCTDDSCVDGECVNEDNTESCDDGDLCTVNGQCVAGECVVDDVICSSSSVCLTSVCENGACVESPNNESCDDGDACTENDMCARGQCTGEIISCPDDVCLEGICANGVCSFAPVSGDSCDDGNPCTINDVCVSGVCSGELLECSGPNECMDYFCNAETGECDNSPNTNSCNDGNECTSLDKCTEGVCEGITSVFCSNTNPCVESTCNTITGTCEDTNIDNECTDFDSCTENDRCESGECIGDPNAVCDPQCTIDEDCLDANACQSAVCEEGVCLYPSVDTCGEQNSLCVSFTCNPFSGECDPIFEDRSCDDGNECTRVDRCIAGVCEGTFEVDCLPVECFEVSCDPETGNCIRESTPGATCDDGDDCTLNDVCGSDGECSGTEIVCNDQNECTNDECVDGVCVFTDNTVVCSDNDLCTQEDRCFNGECIGNPITCEEEECFDVQCVAGECSRSPNNNSCDDGDLCTENDLCVNGQCVGTPIVCVNENECIDSECINGQCFETNNRNSCDDGNPCTTGDECFGGECSGEELDCSSLDSECGRGVCVNGACVLTTDDFDNISCFDVDACTINGICAAGECVGEERDCSSDNECSIGLCDPVDGCFTINNNVSCGESDCSVSLCIEEECVVRSSNSCDDANPCTVDTCDSELGQCVNSFDDSLSCDDGDACTLSVCTENGCDNSQTLDCGESSNECSSFVCLDGSCVEVPEDGRDCIAESLCALSGVCIDSKCEPRDVVSCESENQCAQSQCDEETGECVDVPFDSDAVVPCDDGNACTENDVCSPNMECVGADEISCADPVSPCQISVCDSELGCIFLPNDEGDCSTNDPCSTQECIQGACITTEQICSDDNLCTYEHECTGEGCIAQEYSCIINPCVFLECDGRGLCSITDDSDESWAPKVFIAFTSLPNEQSSEERYFIASIDENTGVFASVIEVSDPVISLEVQPMSGRLFAVGGTNGGSMYRVEKNSIGQLSEGATVFYENLGGLSMDLSFRPSFSGFDLPYTYDLWALSRSNSAFYELDGRSLTTSDVANLGYEVISWDNHGRYLFGIVDQKLRAFDSFNGEDILLCSGIDVAPAGNVISIDVRVGENLVGAIQNGDELSLFIVEFNLDVNQQSICDVTQFAVGVPVNGEVTAVAFDDTICTVGVFGGLGSSGSGGFGGSGEGGEGSGNNAGGSTGNTNGNLGPAPATDGGSSGGSGGDSNFPGESDIDILTGGTEGSVSTLIVGAMGATTVLAFAVFAVLFGINNTKKDPAVPLGAMLEETEASNLAANNPIFEGANGAVNNVIA